MIASGVFTVGTAFAVIQYSPWNYYGGIPNGWNPSNTAYASATTWGDGFIYSISTGFGGTADANSWHNYDTNAGVAKNQPQLTTSGSAIYFGADTSYNVYITKGTFGTAQYKGGANLYKQVNGNSNWQGSCVTNPPISNAGLNTGSQHLTCLISGYTGTNTFSSVGINDAYVTSPWFGSNIVDAKNSPHKITVQNIYVCDTNCYP